MLQYTVLYTSSSEGVTIGVSGDSFVEALSALVEEVGEGVVPLFEHTKSEFIDLCKAIDVQVHEVDDAAADVTPTLDTGPEPEGEEPRDADVVEGGPLVEAELPSGTPPICTVCGIDITPDRAKASELMIGEPRCSECTT